MLFLEGVAMTLAQRDRLAHIDLVEGRQHRGGVLRRLQPLGDPPPQAAHAHPHFALADGGNGWRRRRRWWPRREHIGLRDPPAGSGRRNCRAVEPAFLDQLAHCGPRAFKRLLPPNGGEGWGGGDRAEDCADRYVSALFGEDLRERPGGWRRDLEGYLVGFELGDRLVQRDRLAWTLQPFRHRRLGDRFAEARNLDLGRHRLLRGQRLGDEAGLLLDVTLEEP